MNPRPLAYQRRQSTGIRLNEAHIEEFLLLLRAEGLSETTIKHYKWDAHRIMRYTGGYPTRQKLLKMIAAWQKKYSKYQVLNLYKTMRRLFRDYFKRPDLIEGIRIKWYQPLPSRIINVKDEDVRAAFYRLQMDWERALFLTYATTGIRTSEAFKIKMDQVLWEYRAIVPAQDRGTKKTGITFFNEEAEYWLKRYISQRTDKSDLLFPLSDRKRKTFIKHVKPVTPRVLRKWHATKLRLAGVPDGIIDIFQGRAPRSVLAKYYDIAGIEELKRVYDSANLRILHV